MLDKTQIFWVFGKIGAGKSTFCRRKAEEHNTRALHVGDICREKFGAKKIAESENPMAPEMTEKFVRELVHKSVSSTDLGGNLIIDGMPRKPSQVRWVYENFKSPDFRHYFILLTCEDEIRTQRTVARDGSNSDNYELAKVRIDSEDKSILRVVEEILSFRANFPDCVFMSVNNSAEEGDTYGGLHCTLNDMYENDDIESVKFTDYNIGRMFASIKRFSDVATKKFGITTSDLQKATINKNQVDGSNIGVQWASKFLDATIKELVELRQELPERWWLDEKIDLRACRVELIDAWHFLMSTSLAIGMDFDLFAKTYYDKLEVNWNRQKFSKKKGDDKHVGISKGD